MNFVLKEILAALAVTLVVAVPLAGFAVGLWNDPVSALLGPVAVAGVGGCVAAGMRWSNAATRIEAYSASGPEAARRVSTPSWIPFLVATVVVVPAQAGLNHLVGHLGDGLVGVLVAGLFVRIGLEQRNAGG